MKIKSIYPRVFHANKTQRVYIELDEALNGESISIKIQPMEKYTIPHTEKYRIDEETRYPYVPLLKDNEGRYYTDFHFTSEQRYSVKLMYDEKVIYCGSLYSLNDDLFAMTAYKGDTHLHTCRSDGEGEPFDVGCLYRSEGYDFIAITDHHKHFPSLEARDAFLTLTNEFTVFPGEEIHNAPMGYFHIVNFGGDSIGQDTINVNSEYIKSDIDKILAENDFGNITDKTGLAYRIYIANKIRELGGIAILAHPFWNAFGEYNAEVEQVEYLLRNEIYDAIEVKAACDSNGNGTNLQEALWADIRAEGKKIPVVGASDSHKRSVVPADEFFAIQYTIVFAKSADEIKDAIKDERSVAVNQRDTYDFHVVGRFRYVKYARFLLDEYFPTYKTLCKKHSEALLECKSKERSEDICLAEENIKKYKAEFFA